MRLKKIDKVTPTKDRVITRILDRKVFEDGVYLGGDEDASKQNVTMYYGEVEKIGPNSTDPEHCPGLQVGDTAVFSQFAGHHIATSDNEIHKLIRGYDIMATTTDITTIDGTVLNPTADRLLLEILCVDVDEDGIVMSDADAQDPKLADLDYGKVIKIGPTCDAGYKIGDIVAYEPYAGEVVRAQGDANTPGLKIIIEDDILLK